MQYEKENSLDFVAWLVQELQLLMLQRYDGFSQTPKNCDKTSLSCCDGVGDLRQRGRIG